MLDKVYGLTNKIEEIPYGSEETDELFDNEVEGLADMIYGTVLLNREGHCISITRHQLEDYLGDMLDDIRSIVNGLPLASMDEIESFFWRLNAAMGEDGDASRCILPDGTVETLTKFLVNLYMEHNKESDWTVIIRVNQIFRFL